MRIFSINRSFSNGVEIVKSMNVSLDVLDLNAIKFALEHCNFTDDVLQAQSVVLLENLKSYV